jgi:hypothetical protein
LKGLSAAAAGRVAAGRASNVEKHSERRLTRMPATVRGSLVAAEQPDRRVGADSMRGSMRGETRSVG